MSYDELTDSLIVSITSDNTLTDILSIRMDIFSFRTLLADGEDVKPSDVLVLLDGEEQAYYTPSHITNGNVVWEFKNKLGISEIKITQKPNRGDGASGMMHWMAITTKSQPIKKQFDLGIPFENLICKKQDHVILTKHDGSPACIKESSLLKLITRGWTAEFETKKLWKSTENWNSLRLVLNDSLYCSSANEEPSDHCYSLEEIVFGNGFKRAKHHGWKVYPGGAGWTLPENFTLTPIYKNVEFGIPPLDLEAMLDDKIFVNKCGSNGGVWNYTYHDCEGLGLECKDVGGIHTAMSISTCTTDICLDRGIYRTTCVFEYEN